MLLFSFSLYLKGSPGQGVLLQSNNNLQLHSFCDSDWASCLSLVILSLVILFLLDILPFLGCPRNSIVVSRSSIEAEYCSITVTCCELKWFRYLFKDLRVPISGLILLFCDNQAALYIVSNPIYHDRTKYIEIDIHFVRNEFQAHHISPTYFPTIDQRANIFTKALDTSQFQHFLYKLDICNLHTLT